MNTNVLVLSICGLLALPGAIRAEDVSPALKGQINWSVIRTELEKEALGFVATVSPDLNKARFFGSEDYAGYIGPSFDVRTGGDDTFESVLAKVSGFVRIPPPLDADGEPDSMRWIHIIPFSVGLEADRAFDKPAALAELGWTPIGPRSKIDHDNPTDSQRFGLDANRRAGLFLQTGYKFDSQESTTGEVASAEAVGGQADESKEETEEGIARVKAEITYGFDLFEGVHLLPTATGWYDLVNDETYYRVEVLIRVDVTKQYSLDFRYEKGSGAPNFNEGDQFSTGLTMAF